MKVLCVGSDVLKKYEDEKMYSGNIVMVVKEIEIKDVQRSAFKMEEFYFPTCYRK